MPCPNAPSARTRYPPKPLPVLAFEFSIATNDSTMPRSFAGHGMPCPYSRTHPAFQPGWRRCFCSRLCLLLPPNRIFQAADRSWVALIFKSRNDRFTLRRGGTRFAREKLRNSSVKRLQVSIVDNRRLHSEPDQAYLGCITVNSEAIHADRKSSVQS